MATASSPNSRMLVNYHGAFSITHEMVLLSNPYLSSFPPPCSPTLFGITSCLSLLQTAGAVLSHPVPF
ncbi:hypothetical protein M405DRAFT_829178 [Rhizopogon salebrosus TDB-379]|nr:hypothetical protein M405DRAFT_829178 [Rhizopogon salebrosus TDB-379]